MRSPALAMGWEFRRRHLWALIAMAGYLLALAAIKLLFLGPMEPIRLDPPDGRASVVITPLTATYFYLLTSFSFGLAVDLGSRPSLYPTRTAALLAIHYHVREPMMVAFLAPQLPLAYITACSAVGRARRGDVPDWRGMFARPASNAVLTRRPDHFPSPARAQAWFEWRWHGRSLPALVGLLLPFELALLWLAKDAPAFVFEILFLALITPPFMAACTAWTVSQPNPQVRDSYGLPPFIA